MSESKSPSELFWDAIISAGSCVADCELCDRVHFDGTGRHMDEGELERLLQKQKGNPAKYISHDGDVRYGYLQGKQAVYECPCNKARVHEDYWWSHRYRINRYLALRVADELAEAQRQADAIKEVKLNPSRDGLIDLTRKLNLD